MILAAKLFKFFLKTSLILLFLFGCSSTSEIKSIQGEIFGTTWQVKYVDDQNDLEDLNKSLTHELNRINKIFSTYIDDSYISKVNRGEVSEFENNEFLKLINLSLKIKNQSNGFFNIYINNQYDLNAIAKGYAVDNLAKILNSKNITNFMIEIGGEIRFEGSKGTKNWNFAVIEPSLSKSIHKHFDVKRNLSIATSGDYRNPGHIMNPLTDLPIATKLMSVTVLNETSTATSDAWATALYATPNNEWMQLANKNNIAAYFIYRESGKTVSSSTSKWNELIE